MDSAARFNVRCSRDHDSGRCPEPVVAAVHRQLGCGARLRVCVHPRGDFGFVVVDDNTPRRHDQADETASVQVGFGFVDGDQRVDRFGVPSLIDGPLFGRVPHEGETATRVGLELITRQSAPLFPRRLPVVTFCQFYVLGLVGRPDLGPGHLMGQAGFVRSPFWFYWPSPGAGAPSVHALWTAEAHAGREKSVGGESILLSVDPVAPAFPPGTLRLLL